MLLTANGVRVVSGTLVVPLTGAWQADLSADADEETPLTGAIELALDGAPPMRGVARRAHSYLGRVGVRMVGGKGGLATMLQCAHYKGVPARIPAQDIAADAGEELDAASELDAEFAHWTRVRAPAGVQLADLARELDMPWRVTLEGKLLLKGFTWPDSKVTALEIIDRNPADGTVTIGRFIEPGTTILGEQVTRVAVVVGDDGLRVKAWVGDVRNQ